MKHHAKSMTESASLARNQGWHLKQMRWFSHYVWRIMTRKFSALVLHPSMISRLCQ